MAFKRVDDATFDLNLAPMLDIIVTVIPMLLLSVAFVQVKMIETPVPQVVADAQIKDQKTPPGVSFTLKISNDTGFALVTNDKGKTSEQKVALKGGKFDLDGLVAAVMNVKKSYPEHFRLELTPSPTVSMNELVLTMDAVRRAPAAAAAKFAFKDEKTGQMVATDLMFPDVIFSNVVQE